ncbi:MAG: UDP-N-acetylmuramate dehydrogenase [Puniceicoccales bacterium]|jgi:UDP-N-acetylenolpyruvoylglucosamine reductase|nr:UDP-N-acetylmuramate dehydrogenase [Puniceicoccales bacterium]
MSKQFLFLGIGGMGMAPLASYVRQQGHRVYGFDDALALPWERFLEAQQIVICEQFPQHSNGVIFSSAVKENHPWLRIARERNIPVIRRGYFLAKFCAQKKVVAITGSHGKTTTTAALIDHWPTCSYILGGFFRDHRKPPALFIKDSPYLLCEVDESDRTIEAFHPYMTAAINLEDDHLKAYGSPENLDAAFEKLFSQTRRAVIIPEGNIRLRHIVQNLSVPRFFAPTPSTTHGASHDLENKAIVQKVLEQLAAEGEATILSEVSPSPVFRRHQRLGEVGIGHHRIEIWTDYAHHPTEIACYIEKFQNMHPGKKILCVFQPHRYSRTEQYAQDFAEIFKDKATLLLPVYAANESLLPTGTTERILQDLPQSTKVKYITNVEDLDLQQFDLSDELPEAILFIGAGDIYEQAQRWQLKQCLAQIKDRLIKHTIAFQENFSLKHYNTFQIAAQAHLWIESQSEEELLILMGIFQDFNIPYAIIGHGSNLLLDDFKGVFISLKKMPPLFIVHHRSVTVAAAMPLAVFVKRVAALGFQGCEELAGIPGTIGGALYMNAGAHQQSIGDHLIRIRFLDRSGAVKTILRAQMKFSYRYGFRDGVILEAEFFFPQSESPQSLREKIQHRMRWRRASQPTQPNGGSIFKNPPSHFAGMLIEQAQLKGMIMGGAQVSEKHANFIINADRRAVAKDIKSLLRLMRQKVFEMQGIFLEREILFASDLP